MGWGYLPHHAQAFVRRARWLSAYPGVAIVMAVIGIDLLADGLRGRRAGSRAVRTASPRPARRPQLAGTRRTS